MEYRNKIIQLLERLDARARVALLLDNQFQAGLDALDPDCPCYVWDEAIPVSYTHLTLPTSDLV